MAINSNFNYADTDSIQSTPIDFKTLYEQITMFASKTTELIDYTKYESTEVYDYSPIPMKAYITGNMNHSIIKTIIFQNTKGDITT